MNEAPDRLLLDTHALLWTVTSGLKPAAAKLVIEVGQKAGILISAVSAWELGLLAYPRSGAPRVRLEPTAAEWFSQLLALPTNTEVPVTVDIGLEAAMLPGNFHRDPADRLLVATARLLNVPILTRDRAIHEYAAEGHLTAIPC